MKTNKVNRTRQIGINITEELFQNLKVVAAIEGITFSHKAFKILQQYMEDHKVEIAEYVQFVNNLKDNLKL